MPPRQDERLKVRLKFPDRSKFARLFERELTKGGIFLKSPHIKPIGTAVEVHFLPKGAKLGLQLVGQVIHVVGAEDAELLDTSPGMGVRFFDLDDEKRALIDAYISGRSEDFELPPEPEPETEPEAETETETEEGARPP